MNNIYIPIPISSGVSRSKKRQPIHKKIAEFLYTYNESPKNGRLCAIIKIYFYGTSNSDIDNCLKVIFDGTKNILFKDDSQIKEVRCNILENTHKVGFDIKLIELK